MFPKQMNMTPTRRPSPAAAMIREEVVEEEEKERMKSNDSNPIIPCFFSSSAAPHGDLAALLRSLISDRRQARQVSRFVRSIARR